MKITALCKNVVSFNLKCQPAQICISLMPFDVCGVCSVLAFFTILFHL